MQNNNVGTWTPKTTIEILANTPRCADCHGEGVVIPGSPCKTCHGTGHILSERLRKIYNNLCEKEYYEDEERREEERLACGGTDYSNEDLHMWA